VIGQVSEARHRGEHSFERDDRNERDGSLCTPQCLWRCEAL